MLVVNAAGDFGGTQECSKDCPGGFNVDRFDGTPRAHSHLLEETHEGEICRLCNAGPDVDFSMAFQPIVNASNGELFAYEALARGPSGEPAETVLARTLHNNRYSMDQRCREKAITISASLGILDTPADLSVNFYPNAVYEPRQCLRRTFNAASAVGFPDRTHHLRDHRNGRGAQSRPSAQHHAGVPGVRSARGDRRPSGAGHSGLSLLSVFQPDIIKIDQSLIARIDERNASLAIVRSIIRICGDLNIQIIAEGIEREQEMRVLCDLGIVLMQGFFFAPPAFETLPVWPQR